MIDKGIKSFIFKASTRYEQAGYQEASNAQARH